MPNLRSKTWTTTTPANVEDAQYWEDHLISDEAAAKADGAVQNAFKRIAVQSGGSTTNVDASGEDTGLVFEAGSNVTLTATGKNIRIDSTGGGGGGGSYTAGKGIIISGDEIETDLKGYTLSTETAEAFGSTADRTYAVGLDANGDLAVNIPWTDTDTLDELGDVSLTTPADGDILRYSSEDSEWQNSDALSVAEGAIDQNASNITTLDANKMSYAVNTKLGAHNLAVPLYISTTINKMSVTVDSKGIATINKSEVSTSDAYAIYMQSSTLNKGRYILNGCTGGARNSTYELILRVRNATDTADEVSAYSYDGDSEVFTVPEDGRIVKIYIAGYKNATFSNVKLYPQIREAEDTDTTFAPYTMTNRELTEKTSKLQQDIPIVPFITPALTSTTNDANNLPCGFTRLNDNNANMPTHNNVWYDVMTVRQSNDSGTVNWGYGFQLAVQTTSDSNFGDTYIRALNGGGTPSWSAWKKLN